MLLPSQRECPFQTKLRGKMFRPRSVLLTIEIIRATISATGPKRDALYTVVTGEHGWRLSVTCCLTTVAPIAVALISPIRANPTTPHRCGAAPLRTVLRTEDAVSALRICKIYITRKGRTSGN